MTALKIIYVNSQTPADLLVAAGDGVHLISNTDLNNVVWLARSNAVIAGKQDESIDLDPQSFVVVDGKEDVYAITSGPTVAVRVVGGGVGYFQSGISGSGFQANANGAFFYSGTPGPGNLIEAITGSMATSPDSYGNPFVPGSEMLLNAGKELIYSGNAPALGALLIALAGSAGNDGLGNSWARGATIWGANGSPVGVNLPSRNPHEIAAGFLAVGVLNPGSGNDQAYAELVSPRIAGAADFVQLNLVGPKFNQPTSSQGTIVYTDTAGVQHLLAICGQGGFFTNLCNGLTAVQPGTADTTMTPETWHTITLDSGWTTLAGHPVPQYRMLPFGAVQFIGFAQHASFTSSTNVNSSNPIPAAYRPSGNMYFPGDQNRSGWQVTASGVLTGNPSVSGVGSVQTEFNGIMALV